VEKIALEGMEFFAYHGYYQEERKTGNRYSVDISVEANLEQAAEEDSLRETVNYEKLYHMVSEAMQQPSKLLEHIGHRLAEQTFRDFPEVATVEVSVSKFNPPVGGVCRRAVVTLKRARA
jgi:dihydroneopterin aldolase